MSDHRDTGRAGVRTETATNREAGTHRIEQERIGVHNEAETIRRDRIRWGPIWAGVVTTVGTYLLLQFVLVATALTELDGAAGDDAVWSAVAALIAFFIGGLTTGATSMWQGADDGVLHGIVMWFAALVGVIVLSALTSGLALGSLDATTAFEDVGLEDVDVDAASDDAQEAAGWALLGFALALGAAAAGAAVGNKMWPKDDTFVDVIVGRRDT
jgi:hypothetical protein